MAGAGEGYAGGTIAIRFTVAVTVTVTVKVATKNTSLGLVAQSVCLLEHD